MSRVSSNRPGIPQYIAENWQRRLATDPVPGQFLDSAAGEDQSAAQLSVRTFQFGDSSVRVRHYCYVAGMERVFQPD